MLVYSLIRAPIVGWGSVQTIATLCLSAVLLVAFAINELRSRNPLLPIAILRVNGILAADLTQLIAFCGFFSMFFYATLYMQEVLHYSPLKAGIAYLPITGGFALAGGLASQLVTRIGTRPVVVAGCLVAAVGIYWVSRVPFHGSYVTDLLPRVRRDVPRSRLRVRVGHRGGQRRRASGQGRVGRRVVELVSAGGEHARLGNPLRRGNHPHRQLGSRALWGSCGPQAAARLASCGRPWCARSCRWPAPSATPRCPTGYGWRSASTTYADAMNCNDNPLCRYE